MRGLFISPNVHSTTNITVLLPDGTRLPLKHLPPHTGQKTDGDPVTSWNLSVLVEFAVRPRPVHREPKTPAPLLGSGAGVGFRDNLRP